jgi:hypothetical protein
MNTAMLESFCSDTIMVAGSWMPYGTLRRLGIYYREIESIDKLSKEIEYLLNNIDHEKSKTLNNGKLIRDFLDYSRIAVDWTKTYIEVDQKSKMKGRKTATT